MAIEEGIRSISLPAVAGLQNTQYSVVQLDTDGRIALGGAGEKAIGILLDRPGQNDTTSLDHIARVGLFSSSILKVRLGGVVTQGAHLTPGAAGVALLTAAAGDDVIGIALQAGVSGDVIEFIPSGVNEL